MARHKHAWFWIWDYNKRAYVLKCRKCGITSKELIENAGVEDLRTTKRRMRKVS